jgi:hypothetical protein
MNLQADSRDGQTMSAGARWAVAVTAAVVVFVVAGAVAKVAGADLSLAATVAAVPFTITLAVLSPWAERARSEHKDNRQGQLSELWAAADDLADAVIREWEREATVRLLNDPAPISVQWEPAEPGLVADWQSLVALARTGVGWPESPPNGTWAAGPEGLAGSGKGLAEVLGRVPTGRLVVLGEPGTGKTILLVRLVLDLLRRRVRGSGTPVPVLVSLASWNPDAQELYDWLERRLAIDYIGLGRKVSAGLGQPHRHLGRGGRRSLGRTLLDERLIMLVLDGFDEIPAAVRDKAFTRINDALGPGQGLVLASRLAAYREAARPRDGSDAQLAGAAGVVVHRLDGDVAADYLRASAGGPDSATRWDRLLPKLATNSALPAAQALTTPLMVSLARVIYNPRPGESLATVRKDPGELLDPARFPTSTSVEKYLLDAFVPAAYRQEPDLAERANRWLIFLARDLEKRLDPTSLAWWEISGAAPGALAGLCVGVVAGIAGAIGLAIPDATGIGLIAAVLVGLLVRQLARHGSGFARTLLGGLLGGHGSGLGWALLGGLLGGLAGTLLGLYGFPPLFGFHQTEPLGPAVTGALAAAIAVVAMRSFQAGLAGGFAGGLAAVLVSTRHVSLGAQLVNGLGLGLACGCAAALAYHTQPAGKFKWSLPGFMVGAAAGITMGYAVTLQAGVVRGLTVGLIAALVGSFAMGVEAAPADPMSVPSPRNALLRDRNTFWATAILAGLAIGLSTALGPPYPRGTGNPVEFAVKLGIANTIAVGLAAGFIKAAYGRFALGRWWLAAGHHLPWRLMTFLADAHEHRGVLRQTGSVYEFRHADLQHRLAHRGVDE